MRLQFHRLLSILLLCGTPSLCGCGEEEGGIYACSYQTRSTGCGGVGWSSWEEQCYEFNLDDYQEGWSAQRVCDKFSGNDTECGGSCCIEVQYQQHRAAPGRLPLSPAPRG